MVSTPQSMQSSDSLYCSTPVKASPASVSRRAAAVMGSKALLVGSVVLFMRSSAQQLNLDNGSCDGLYISSNGISNCSLYAVIGSTAPPMVSVSLLMQFSALLMGCSAADVNKLR